MEEDEPRAHFIIRPIKLGDVSVMAGDHPTQSKFCVAIEKGALTAAPMTQRELSYFEWSIVTDPTEIDSNVEYTGTSKIIPDSM